MNTAYAIIKCIPSYQEVEFLEDRLYEHNSGKTGLDDGQIFAFFIRGEQQEILAGISGWTWAGACEIRQLWVSPALRGQGYGKVLLQSAENEARSRGCQVILIGSFSFQAPDFYQACGYEPAYQVFDFPPGYRYHFLIKRFIQSGNPDASKK